MKDRARALLRERSRRGLFFPHLDEPAWLMLVDLYVHDGRDVSITSACLASFVPMTTALRHIEILEIAGLIFRQRDRSDGRRSYLRLSATASVQLDMFFSDAPLPEAPRDPGASSFPGTRLEAGVGGFVNSEHATPISREGKRDHA